MLMANGLSLCSWFLRTRDKGSIDKGRVRNRELIVLTEESRLPYVALAEVQTKQVI